MIFFSTKSFSHQSLFCSFFWLNWGHSCCIASCKLSRLSSSHSSNMWSIIVFFRAPSPLSDTILFPYQLLPYTVLTAGSWRAKYWSLHLLFILEEQTYGNIILWIQIVTPPPLFFFFLWIQIEIILIFLFPKASLAELFSWQFRLTDLLADSRTGESQADDGPGRWAQTASKASIASEWKMNTNDTEISVVAIKTFYFLVFKSTVHSEDWKWLVSATRHVKAIMIHQKSLLIVLAFRTEVQKGAVWTRTWIQKK